MDQHWISNRKKEAVSQNHHHTASFLTLFYLAKQIQTFNRSHRMVPNIAAKDHMYYHMIHMFHPYAPEVTSIFTCPKIDSSPSGPTLDGP